MFEVNTAEYMPLLETHYDAKIPMMIYGAPGIGKSAIPRLVFEKVAKKKGRKFMEWSDMTQADKANAYANAKDYFIFTDFRLGQCDTTDVKGIPNMSNPQMLEYMPLAWAKYYTDPEADGVVFFDEINLAPPVVAGQCYQIINDRVVSDLRLSDNVWLFGAGNRPKDRAHVFSMPAPLRDRFSEVELNVSDEEWCIWAFDNDVNPHLIAFIKWKPTSLYCMPENTEDKGSTPRGVVRASTLLGAGGWKAGGGSLNIESPKAGALVSMAVGEAFATEFQAYAKVASKIDLDSLMKKPESVKQYANSPDKLFAICGLLGEHLPRYKPTAPETAKLFAVAHELPKEYSVVALNMIRTSYKSNAKFKQALTKYPKFKEILESAARFALS